MAVCYDNKLVLAPMVRVGTLPFRLLAASYGAEIVYTEEIVDLKLVKTERRVDPIKGIVEYVVRQENNNGLEATVFSTLAVPGRAREGAHVILQLGTGGAESALAAARHVEADVDGIDVNMGCPKRFSTQGGMGSALLTEPHKVHAILTTLVKNIKKPVSCKIRILEEDEPTVALLRLIAATGVSAIGIHPRVPNARTDKVPANYVRLANILRAAGDLRVPIILSGDVFEPTPTSMPLFPSPQGASLSILLVTPRATILSIPVVIPSSSVPWRIPCKPTCTTSIRARPPSHAGPPLASTFVREMSTATFEFGTPPT